MSTSGFASSSTPNTIYDLTKGGLRQLTISAAVELAPLGVNVNGVAPGTVATELTTAVLDTPEKLARATARIPRGTFGRPADIAAAVAFLSSDDADYIHGHVLVVDGGWRSRPDLAASGDRTPTSSRDQDGAARAACRARGRRRRWWARRGGAARRR